MINSFDVWPIYGLTVIVYCICLLHNFTEKQGKGLKEERVDSEIQLSVLYENPAKNFQFRSTKFYTGKVLNIESLYNISGCRDIGI